MSKETGNSKFGNVPPAMLGYVSISVLLFVANLYVYQVAPFEGSLNNTILNIITVVSALMVAVISSAIFFHYHPEDSPRRIWLYMSVAAWLWALAEAAWGAIAFVEEEVAAPGIPDIGWVCGFIFFTIAFHYQYTAIFPSQKKRITSIAIGAWALAIFVPLIGLFATQTFTPETYINYYYPIADLVLGVAGITLVFAFRGGALMRPWFGLFFFGISDLFYAWAEQTGLYEWSAQNSNTLTVTIDSLYLAAYLIFGLGLLGHWLLINHGLPSEN